MPPDAMGMGDSMAAGAAAPAATPPAAPTEGQDEGAASIFLSKENLGGKAVKEGDRITLTVKSVDPETGDVEAAVDAGAEEAGESDINKAFDKAMPPEPGESGGY